MKMNAAVQEFDRPWEGLTVLQPDRSEPLSECVRKALRFYLQNLDGYEAKDIHEMVLAEVERPMLETVLEHTHGNQTQAARMLGLSRSTLRKKIAQHRVQIKS